ncbi:MAG: hypothetical protein FWC41_12665, partial [Firmicutes bacterium]|nr:hypothetical protein [Bacillota bacterium]
MKSYDFETVVLRFRDLATGIGETIDNHKNVIKNDSKRPYVWWAWWNKGGESIPQGEFMYLNSLAERNELDLFLLDSGRNKLYKA